MKTNRINIDKILAYIVFAIIVMVFVAAFLFCVWFVISVFNVGMTNSFTRPEGIWSWNFFNVMYK